MNNSKRLEILKKSKKKKNTLNNGESFINKNKSITSDSLPNNSDASSCKSKSISIFNHNIAINSNDLSKENTSIDGDIDKSVDSIVSTKIIRNKNKNKKRGNKVKLIKKDSNLSKENSSVNTDIDKSVDSIVSTKIIQKRNKNKKNTNKNRLLKKDSSLETENDAKIVYNYKSIFNVSNC